MCRLFSHDDRSKFKFRGGEALSSGDGFPLLLTCARGVKYSRLLTEMTVSVCTDEEHKGCVTMMPMTSVMRRLLRLDV